MPKASEFSSNRPPDLENVGIYFDDKLAFTIQLDKSKVTRHWARAADKDFYAALLEVVTGWDLLNDDETPYELTAENWVNLKLTLPQEVELLDQIVEAAQPSRAEGNESSQPSSEKPSTPAMELPSKSPNGSETSESQSVSAVGQTR